MCPKSTVEAKKSTILDKPSLKIAVSQFVCILKEATFKIVYRVILLALNKENLGDESGHPRELEWMVHSGARRKKNVLVKFFKSGNISVAAGVAFTGPRGSWSMPLKYWGRKISKWQKFPKE